MKGWIVAAVLAVALIVGFLFLPGSNRAEVCVDFRQDEPGQWRAHTRACRPGESPDVTPRD